MTPRQVQRRGGLVALVSVLLTLAAVSWIRTSQNLAAVRVCDRTDAGDWLGALEEVAGASFDDPSTPATRLALGCACAAQYATKQGAACVETMRRLLFVPGARDWVPDKRLTLRLIEVFAQNGEPQRAAELAMRAAASAPAEADFFKAELEARLALEDVSAVLDSALPRLEALAEDERFDARIDLAERAIVAEAYERALTILGRTPPPPESPAMPGWYEKRMASLAAMDDRAGMDALLAGWASVPGHAPKARATFAFFGDIRHIFDPDVEGPKILAEVLADEAAIGDPELVEGLYYRAIGGLAVRGRSAEALALYAQAVARGHALIGIDPDDLERTMRASSEPPREVESGALRFLLPAGTPGALLLSPAESDPPDTEFTSIAEGNTVTRPTGLTPQRWVLEAPGGALASGLAWVAAGKTTEVVVTPSAVPHAPLAAANLTRRAADGNRRTFVVILDCFDWRLLSYLRARGDMPNVDALLSTSWHAVLFQSPALTAAAMDALAHPEPRRTTTMLGIVNDLGVELGGLESIGRNPLAPLEGLLPSRADLFQTIGAGGRSIANLIFAHGDINAGRNAVVTGPNGAENEIGLPTMRRPLRNDESQRFGSFDRLSVRAVGVQLVETIAAQFDQLERFAGDPTIDTIVFRVEPIDILTHGFFGDTTHAGQDDGKGALFDVYRYVDRRIGEFVPGLDADDMLILMSDHGIRTSMRHDEHAFFLVNGPGVPVGRAEGLPALRGLGRVISALVGVKTDWPDTGVAPWLTNPSAPSGAGSLAPPHSPGSP